MLDGKLIYSLDRKILSGNTNVHKIKILVYWGEMAYASWDRKTNKNLITYMI